MMKNFTILCMAMAIAGSSAMAAAAKHTPNSMKSALRMAREASARVKNLPNPGDDSEIVYDRPDGEVTYYSRTCIGYQEYFGTPMPILDEGSVVTFVEQADGTVWIHNAVSQFLLPAWIKGEKNADGTEITVTGPQLVYQEEDWDTGEMLNYYLTPVVLETRENDYGEEESEYVVKEDGVFTFTVNPETHTIKEAGTGDIILGIVTWTEEDGYFWVGYGDNFIVCTLPKDKPVEVPASAEVHKDWAMKFVSVDVWGESTEDARFVDVAMDGDDYYVRGIYPALPDAWVKGTRQADGTLLVPHGQYLGRDMESLYFAYIAAGSVVYDEDTESSIAMIDESGVEFDIEQDGGLSALSNILIVPVPHTDADNANFLYYMEALEVMPQNISEIKEPRVPTDMFLGGMDGVGAIECDMKPLDVEGHLLKGENLYYRAYVNSSRYTFSPELYDIFDVPTEEVPYELSDDYNIFAEGSWRTIYLLGIEQSAIYNIGIQMVYYPEGKDVNPDNVLESYVSMVGEENPDSVEGISGEEGVKSVKYYDMHGRNADGVNAPGVYVCVTEFADGSCKARKVVVK